MNTSQISFSPEQALLLDIAGRTLRERWPIDKVREHLEVGAGHSAELEREMSDLGWYGLAVPEAHGGSDQGLAELVPLVEPMGRHLVAGPFVATQIGVQGLLALTDPNLHATWLPKINQGQALAVALLEGDGSWDLERPTTLLEPASDGGFTLTGEKILVTDLEGAAGLLVTATTGDGPALVLLEPAQIAALERREDRVIDLTRRSTSVRFSALPVRADQTFTGPAAVHALQALRDAAWLLSAAEACGGLQGVLDVLLEYLRNRRQFGRTIGSYQALKHPTVDLLIGLERARSLLYHAATVVAHPESQAEAREIALRMAKAEANDAFLQAADRAIQFHGGVGFTWECDAQLYLRRALWLQALWGDAPHHRQRLADLLLN
jgi:alkylation response protein AidB-like acyl-CoA dehydrogenase